MNTGLLIQYVVIGLAVFASALYAFRKLAPQLTNRWLASASIHFSQPGHAAWVRTIGRRLQPKQATGSCSDGCSTCGACGPKPPANMRSDAMPLEFRPRQH
ncbi:DUF6587 family protein [Dyella flagellata]|uniref:Uncharacterized protein n=1 Tax=Dyella flagellata TaxID=1867833 RepID=A0ABQ5XID4_9GAMM|nr:DUF6587 family protein [Dyella flagellata]GLQ90298.1 hypothetical protein GCM10007898_38730 [Dyella flagellata]